jgi:sulfate permease, SulP family
LPDPAKSPASSIKSAWPILQAFAGYRLSSVPADLISGLTLAAIAIPAQMATAKLAGFPPQFGFFALIAGAVGFAIFGNSRFLSCGADSTIAPIFAGALLSFAAIGTPDYAASAAMLALMVGALVLLSGLFRFDWIADLLSLPVTVGFFTGIAIHIVVAQLPSLLGVAASDGTIPQKIAQLARHLGETNSATLLIGAGVFALICICEWISARLPGALIGLVAATSAVIFFDLNRRGVAVLGTIDTALPTPHVPIVSLADLVHLGTLSFIVALVVMMQTAATTRSFPSTRNGVPDIHRDYIGVGAGSLIAGFIGAFPINASPPSTAILFETGGRSQLASLFVAGLVVALLVYGGTLFRFVPEAAFAAVLLFVAMRLIKLHEILAIFRQSFPEFLLILATAAAIVALPIEQGVAVGIVLSLLQGIWSTTRARVVRFVPVAGTSVWWPMTPNDPVESHSSVLVLGLQAPLTFLNADHFHSDVKAALKKAPDSIRLLVLEASGILELDFTAAQTLRDVIKECRASKVDFAVARLESLRAQAALQRFGLADILGRDHIFHSVDEAIRNLSRRQAG